MDKSHFSPAVDPNLSADDFFAQIKQSAQTEEKKGRELSEEEDRKMQDGFAVQEMMHTAGWSIVADILSNMPKAHIDPRGMSQEEWQFAELNAFHAGQVASELLQGLQTLVNDAHQLHKIKLGEIQENQRMRI